MADQVIRKREPVFSWQKVIQYGLISGVAVVYVCLVGMVEAFNDRDVIYEILTLGLSLLVVFSLGMGYVVAQKQSAGKVGKALVGGLVVGLISGAMTSMLVILIETTNIREMFVNASPALVEILTFSQDSLAVGLLMLMAFLTMFSILGAAIYLVPPLPRGMLVAGLSAVLLIGMLQELLDVILSRHDLSKSLANFLFAKNGLSIVGAITVFVVFAGFNGLWSARSGKMKKRYATLPSPQQRAISWVFMAVAVIFLLALPQVTGPYISQILVLVGLYTLMGLGLNIEIGLAGLLDLGFVGFFAIGAYVTALLTSTSEVGLASVFAGEATGEMFTNFWVSIPVAVAVAGLAGVFLGIPVLRMRGDYLAIVTLGFAEIIRILVLSDFLRPLLGGAQGILNIPKPALTLLNFTIKDPQHFYYLIIIGCVIIAFVAWRLQYSRVGRNWMAMREDEDVAEAMGINLIASKLLAFGIGAAFAGLSGAIFASQVGSVFPHSFALLVSINVVCIVIIGGVGSIPGVVVGSLVLVGMPELLREFAEFRLLIYGALLVVMMLVKPEGLWPSEIRKRELHVGDETLEPQPAVTDQALEAT
jgi:branched-chain amino acid transport system permease protein